LAGITHLVIDLTPTLFKDCAYLKFYEPTALSRLSLDEVMNTSVPKRVYFHSATRVSESHSVTITFPHIRGWLFVQFPRGIDEIVNWAPIILK
jgi:hypothetical protein